MTQNLALKNFKVLSKSTFWIKKWTFQIVCFKDKISFALHCRAKKLVTSMKKGDSGKLQMLISQLEMSLES